TWGSGLGSCTRGEAVSRGVSVIWTSDWRRLLSDLTLGESGCRNAAVGKTVGASGRTRTRCPPCPEPLANGTGGGAGGASGATGAWLAGDGLSGAATAFLGAASATMAG